MPQFSLTPEQQQAFEALRWLNGPDHRRSGRTHVLAMHYVWRCLFTAGAWVEIEDHHRDRQTSNALLRRVLQLAESIGVELETGRRDQVRLARAVSRERALQCFAEFGEFRLEEPSPVRVAFSMAKGVRTQEVVPASIWDRLRDE